MKPKKKSSPIAALLLTVMLLRCVLGCSFPSEGTGALVASGDGSSSTGGASATTTATTSASSSASSSSASGPSSSDESSSGSVAASSSDGSEESSDDDASSSDSSTSSDEGGSSSTGELEPYGQCDPSCELAGMVCLSSSAPGCPEEWCEICSPTCDVDAECGEGSCASQCVIHCDAYGGCPEGMACVEVGASFGDLCMWPEGEG